MFALFGNLIIEFIKLDHVSIGIVHIKIYFF